MSEISIKVGIVGCGFISEIVHIPALLKSRNASIRAVCDSNGILANNVARKFGIKAVYSDFTEMLQKEKLDIIDICTPISTHAPLAIESMEAGCHVLVEKPMAHSVEEADDMVRVSKQNGVKLCVIQNMLFLPPVMKIKDLIKKGELGDITRVEIKHSAPPWDYPQNADPNHWWHTLPGGVFGDSLPHAIYLAREFLGDIEPTSIFVNKLGRYEHLHIDDAQIILKGKTGIGTIIYSMNWPSLWHLDIMGTKRTVQADLNNSYLITCRGKTKSGGGIAIFSAIENLSRSYQILFNSLNTGFKMISGTHKGHPVLIRKFIESIEKKAESPVSVHDGREVVRLWEIITNKMESKLD